MKVAPRTDPISGNLYALAGEMTYCENGHALGKFARDIKIYAESGPDDFVIEPGMAWGAFECPFCAGRVVDSAGVYFFEQRAVQ